MEIPYEGMSVAVEATRFTAVTPPTRRLNVSGTIDPEEGDYTPADNMGTTEEAGRTAVTRRDGVWSGSGDLDIYAAPLIMGMVAKGGVAPTTPADGVLTRLGTYVPTITADNLKTATMYWGDPNIRIFKGAGGTVDMLEIESDAKGTDPTKWSLSGRTQGLTDIATPALPAANYGPLLIPGNMQVWIDAVTIGTTAITGRVLSAKHSIPVNWAYKYPAGQDPATIPTYTRLGRGKRRIETTIEFELPDMTQWDQWKNQTTLKVRVRHNGPLIESVGGGPTLYYHYVEIDTYGPFRFGGWGEYEGTNRTITLIIRSIMDTGISASWAAKVQTIAAPFA